MGRTPKKDKNLVPGHPLKPANLSARAALEWDRLAEELTASGIQVTSAHRSTMSLAATIAADIADAWAAIQRDGAYITGKAGLVAHPASKRLDALRRDRIKVLSMLGLRAAVTTPDDAKDESLADMLGA
jgi:phage terminase small subunit